MFCFQRLRETSHMSASKKIYFAVFIFPLHEKYTKCFFKYLNFKRKYRLITCVSVEEI